MGFYPRKKSLFKVYYVKIHSQSCFARNTLLVNAQETTKKMLHDYLELSREDIQKQLADICARQYPDPGRRQVPFNEVETLLCHGLFTLCDPHRYGGANIHTVPPTVTTLAMFFRRTPGSLISKMLNLDGSRTHSARSEPLLFATLAAEPMLYHTLYLRILNAARDLLIQEHMLPDFLDYLSLSHPSEELLGQEDLPTNSGALLADAEEEMKHIENTFALSERLTEKLAERKIRLAQHRFAKDVLENCEYQCVFCGFESRSLLSKSNFLRASHIKPWAVSTPHERVDLKNGLAACPIHDAAFDQGYLTVSEGFHISRANLLQESATKDYRADIYFDQILFHNLFLPANAKKPDARYLLFHREHIFKGML
jgi:putative restriction endonuclease